jgi:hypothetical protein
VPCYYHPVQNILSFVLLPENINIKIYKTVFLSLLSCGTETWSLMQREHKLMVFENRMLRRIFG